MYWGQALFFKHYLRFPQTTITSELFALQQRIWHHRVSLVKTNPVISNFARNKKQLQNFTSRPIRGDWSDQVKAGHICLVIFILSIIWFGVTRQTRWYSFHSSITFGSKVMGKRVEFPHGVINGRGRKLTWPEVTKMKNPKYKFCRYRIQYFVLKAWKHSGWNCAHSTIFKFEAGPGMHINLASNGFPDETRRFFYIVLDPKTLFRYVHWLYLIGHFYSMLWTANAKKNFGFQ